MPVKLGKVQPNRVSFLGFGRVQAELFYLVVCGNEDVHLFGSEDSFQGGNITFCMIFNPSVFKKEKRAKLGTERFFLLIQLDSGSFSILKVKHCLLLRQ